MKRIIVNILTIVALITSTAIAKEDSNIISREVEEKAHKAFAEGKSYFIWSMEEEPVQPGGGNPGLPQMWIFKFGYISKGENNVPFRAIVALPIKDAKSPEIREFKTGIHFDGYEKNKNGEARAFFMASKYKVKGSGEARIYLIKEPENPKKNEDDNKGQPISNILTIKVLAKDE